jgi:hypothetical protein
VVAGAHPNNSAAFTARSAFAVQGGGTLSSVDVIPSSGFRPEDLAVCKSAFNVIGEEGGVPSLVHADRVGAEMLVQRVLDFVEGF